MGLSEEQLLESSPGSSVVLVGVLWALVRARLVRTLR